MNIKESYETLLNHWTKEMENVELSPFNDKRLNDYKKIINDVKALPSDHGAIMKNELIKLYKEKFSFVFDDFLKLRETKIINAALALADLNLETLTESEKLFYKNLVAAIKGFEKVKNLTPLNVLNDSIDDKKEKIGEILDSAGLEQLETQEGSLESEEEPKLKEVDVSDLFDDDQKVDVNFLDERPAVTESQEISKADWEEPSEDYQYTLIRFLEDTPQIIGVDLLIYGPFEKEDVANLPEKNARILISEKLAELLRVN